MNMLNTIKTY